MRCLAQDSDLADIDRSRLFRSIRCLTSMGIPCLAAVLSVVGLSSVATVAPNDVVLIGQGWGHGRGRGQ